MRKTYLCKRTCQGMVEDVRPLALRRDAEQFSSKLHSLFFFLFYFLGNKQDYCRSCGFSITDLLFSELLVLLLSYEFSPSP